MNVLSRYLAIACAVLLGSAPSFVTASEIGGAFSPPTLGTTILPFGGTTPTVDGLTLTNTGGINGLTPAQYLATEFGTGADGTVTVSAGTTTLSREMNYANLTVNGTGHLNQSTGHWIRVSGTLDLTSCPAGGIFPQIDAAVYNPTAGNASGATGGTSTGVFSNRSDVPAVSSGGVAGKSGGTGVGTAGTQDSATAQWMLGGRGGAAGGGGASGTPNAGGALAAQRAAAGFGVNLSLTSIDPKLTYWLSTSLASIQLNGAGAVGGAGGGDGVNAGGGSGGSGAAAGPLRIAANTISRGGSTAASCIAALGENAGTSAAGVAGTAGGGGGSGGGGGGWIHLVVGTLTGSTATNALDVSGGIGAAGGNGSTTGVGGDGAQGGNCGSIDIINLAANTYTHPITGDGAGTAGGAHSGATGGIAGPGCNGKANL